MNEIQKNELNKLKRLLLENKLNTHNKNRLILFIETLEQENKQLKEQLQQKEVEIKDLCKKIKTNEKSRRKMQKSLMEKLQQKEDIINKITNYCKFQIEKEQDKFPKPLESEKWLKGRISAFEEILDNKGE